MEMIYLPIKQVSKYNYKEICDELNIDYNDFLGLIQKREYSKTKCINELNYKAIFVIDEFIKHLHQQDILGIKSKNTYKYYLYFLYCYRSFLFSNHKDLLFSEINEDILYEFMADKKKGSQEFLSQSSMNTYIAIIKRLCTFSVEKGFLNKNISYKFKKIKVNYLPRYFTNSQLQGIFEVVEKRRCALLWKTLFITLLGTGLRVDEIAKLKIRDVNFHDQMIYTLGKGKKERYIPLYPTVKDALLQFLTATGVDDYTKAKDGLVFSREKGNTRTKKVSVRSIQYNLQVIRTELELDERYTIHSFRHTFAVNCLKANMPIMYLCQILGHESPSTTAIYTKLLPKDLQIEISEKFPLPFEGLVKEVILGDDINGKLTTGD
jgi:site-specific recombinase XerD